MSPKTTSSRSWPAPARLSQGAPTWSAFVQSFVPVRELEPGDRPREWATSAETMNDVAEQPMQTACTEAPPAMESPAPARLESERYKVQFTAGDEYVKLVEEAKALLSHSDPRISLDELHLRAMRALVADLQRKKQAATSKPRKPAKRSPDAPAPEAEQKYPRQRGRHVPAAVRRAVFSRDQGRCTYCDETGQRCRETHGLELHHLRPFAWGGEHTAENITLRCHAHNTLAAEEDFGKELVERAKDSSDHQPWVVTASKG
ncbi:MAG TPA: HNH endonuclease [Polyangiaceae bacterium]|nr:HNH endonuclease [Polyangiaceae bacterium]